VSFNKQLIVVLTVTGPLCELFLSKEIRFNSCTQRFLCRCFYAIVPIEADRNKAMKDGKKITSLLPPTSQLCRVQRLLGNIPFRFCLGANGDHRKYLDWAYCFSCI